jgi:mono/diheme cytochrome c family protein
MRNPRFSFVVLPAMLLAGLTSAEIASRQSAAQSTAKQAQQTSGNASQAEVARGRYIVEEVARCPECHSPRDAQGNPDQTRWLQGAPIWITPVHPDSKWADRAPALAGFPGYTQVQGEQILEMGRSATGGLLQPPMHPYHLTHADAQAVIAYLRSLPSVPQ